MTTSNVPTTPSSRSPLRLRMAAQSGRGTLDGGWWPQSRDLVVEMTDLVDHFPAERGRVTRIVFSPPDWDPGPRRIEVASGYVEVVSLPRADTHLALLTTSDGQVLRLLVVPPEMSTDEGAEALLAAATADYAHTAQCLLDTVSDGSDVDPGDYWADGGSRRGVPVGG